MSLAMVTMVTDIKERVAPKTGVGIGGAGKAPRNGGARRNGQNGNNGHGGGGGSARRFPHQSYRIGIWIALAAILMMFAALTSAYVFRSGTASWGSIALPRILWLSTALIAASSFSMEAARRAFERADYGAYRRWLMATLALGAGFLVSQVFAWQQLVRQGVYLSSNPRSAFVYVLTGLHGAHLVGGLAALLYLFTRAMRNPPRNAETHARRKAGASAVAIYWHFMDGLWVYLFLLLLLWR